MVPLPRRVVERRLAQVEAAEQFGITSRQVRRPRPTRSRDVTASLLERLA